MEGDGGVFVLGRVEVMTDGRRAVLAPRQRNLLALLVAAGPDGCADDRLAEELWPAGPPATWPASLRNAVSKLRTALAPMANIVNEGGRYRIDAPIERVDLWRLRSFDRNRSTDWTDPDVYALLTAGDPFAGIDWGPMVTSAAHEAEWIIRRRLTKLVAAGTDELPTAAVAEVMRLAADNPYDLVRRPPFPTSLTAATKAPLPPSLQRVLDSSFAAVDELDDVRLFRLVGPQPNGTNAVLAHLAHGRYRRGHTIIDLSPGLSDRPVASFAAVLGIPVDSEPGAAVSTALKALSRVRPLTVIVRDHHRLDAQSTDLLFRLLDDNDLTFDLFVTGPIESATFQARARRTIPVPPIDADDVEQLLIQRAPERSADIVRHIAGRIHAVTRGDLAAARLMVEDVARGGAAFNAADYHAAAAHMVADIPRIDLMVGAALSLARSELTDDELAEIIELAHRQQRGATPTPDEIVTSVGDAVDRLLSTGFVADGQRHLSIRMDNGPLADAIEERLAPSDLVALARLVRGPAGRSPGAELDEIVAETTALAHRRLDDGAIEDAYFLLRQAERLDRRSLGARGLAALASAEARMGAFADSARHRLEAVALAAASGEASAALAAAAAGLPEAELSDGEPDRIALLHRISTDQLSPEERVNHAFHLARQSALIGDIDRVDRCLDQLGELIETDRGRVELLKLRSFVEVCWNGPAKLLDDVLATRRRLDGAPARLHGLESTLHLQSGRLTEAEQAATAFLAKANTEGDVMSIWLAQLGQATHAFHRGRWDLAGALADDAATLGFGAGITEALDARAAQAVFPYWVTDRLAELAPLFDGAGPSGRSSTPAEIAAVAVRHAAGADLDQCLAEARRLLRRCHRSRLASNLPVSVMLVRLAIESADDELNQLLVEMLEPLRQTHLVFNSSVVDLGPADLHLAILTGDPELAAATVDWIDRSGSVLWPIVARRWLVGYNLHGDDPSVAATADRLATAAGLDATTPGFVPLLVER